MKPNIFQWTFYLYLWKKKVWIKWTTSKWCKKCKNMLKYKNIEKVIMQNPNIIYFYNMLLAPTFCVHKSSHVHHMYTYKHLHFVCIINLCMHITCTLTNKHVLFSDLFSQIIVFVQEYSKLCKLLFTIFKKIAKLFNNFRETCFWSNLEAFFF